MSAAGMKWYVVRTHAHAEARAAEQLRRQGFVTYLPRYRAERSHARRCDVVEKPLFPRYCFVAIDVTRQRWHAIRSTFGVAQLVGGDAGPAVVQDDVVGELMRREDENGFIRLEPRMRFAAGDRVRLVDNIFSLCSALVEGMMDRDRVAILLDLMGRKVRMVVNQAALATE
jgi:transcriptional antiterminator RfaH